MLDQKIKNLIPNACQSFIRLHSLNEKCQFYHCLLSLVTFAHLKFSLFSFEFLYKIIRNVIHGSLIVSVSASFGLTFSSKTWGNHEDTKGKKIQHI